MRFSTYLLMHLRFLLYVLWEFRWPLGIFWALVLGGGLGLRALYHHKELGYPEACFHVFTLAFLQPTLDFPQEWYLQPFFFLVPMIGLGAVAESLVRLGYLVFARKSHLPEWQRMIASTYRHHIVVVGLGKVGYRIVNGLVALREPVVVVELRPDSEFLDEIRALGVAVILGNGRHHKTLVEAGVGHARAIILATDDDLANLDGALTARQIQPKIQVVLRLFDDTLAAKFAGPFAMPAISTSEVAAPAFIAAATGHKVYHAFQLDGAQLHLTDLKIAVGGSLARRSAGEIQAEHSVNLVMLRDSKGVHINPAHDMVLAAEDTVLVIAPMERLVALEAANHGPGLAPAPAPSAGAATKDVEPTKGA
jgi:Trk K+ transport system NAD-binding subunit